MAARMTKVMFTSSKASDGNMSFRKSSPNDAMENRLKFFKKNNLNYEDVIGMTPTHTNSIRIVNSSNKGDIIDETDGLISINPGVILFTMTGDCIPLSVAILEKNLIGLFHISWKNADNDFMKDIVETLSSEFQVTPKELQLTIGPSICPECYIVENPGQKDDPKWQPYLSKISTPHTPSPTTYSIDLAQMVTDRFIKLGVPANQIKNLNLCTFHMDYFSHRKSVIENSPDDFRFGTLLTIR